MVQNSTMCHCCITLSVLWPTLSCKVKLVCCTKLKDCCHEWLRGFTVTHSYKYNRCYKMSDWIKWRKWGKRGKGRIMSKMKRWHINFKKDGEGFKKRVWQLLMNSLGCTFSAVGLEPALHFPVTPLPAAAAGLCPYMAAASGQSA